MSSVAVANFLVGVVYQLFHLPLNFFPALFATFAICLAIRALFAVRRRLFLQLLSPSILLTPRPLDALPAQPLLLE